MQPTLKNLSMLSLLIATFAVGACTTKTQKRAEMKAKAEAREQAREQRKIDGLKPVYARATANGFAWSNGYGVNSSGVRQPGYALASVSRTQLEATACDVSGIGKLISLEISAPDANGMRTLEALCSPGGFAALVGGDKATGYPKAGVTYLSFTPPTKGLIAGHGFQVAYLAADGNEYLWYPNNRAVVGGEWQVRADKICFRYGKNTYNPATRKQGGDFKCAPLSLQQRTMIAEIDGDRFGLASGKVPYPLDKCNAPADFEFDREEYKCSTQDR